MMTAEQAVLGAALEGDRQEMRRRLQEFLPGERRRIEKACDLVLAVLDELEEER